MTTHRIIFLLTALFGPLVYGQEVAVKKLDSNRLEFTLTTDVVLDVAAAQLLLQPHIEQVCGDAQPNFEKYHFESIEPLYLKENSEQQSSYRFVQEITCGDAIESVIKVPDFGVRRNELQQDLENFIDTISIEFLENRSAGAFQDAYAALSGEMRSLTEFEEWSRQAQDFNKTSGPLESAIVWRVTVYKNPQGASKPGTYIAADYEIKYEHVPFKCGYLMWFQLPEQRYVIMREESGIIPQEVVERIPEKQLSQVKAQFGCAR